MGAQTFYPSVRRGVIDARAKPAQTATDYRNANPPATLAPVRRVSPLTPMRTPYNQAPAQPSATESPLSPMAKLRANMVKGGAQPLEADREITRLNPTQPPAPAAAPAKVAPSTAAVKPATATPITPTPTAAAPSPAGPLTPQRFPNSAGHVADEKGVIDLNASHAAGSVVHVNDKAPATTIATTPPAPTAPTTPVQSSPIATPAAAPLAKADPLTPIAAPTPKPEETSLSKGLGAGFAQMAKTDEAAKAAEAAKRTALGAQARKDPWSV